MNYYKPTLNFAYIQKSSIYYDTLIDIGLWTIDIWVYISIL